MDEHGLVAALDRRVERRNARRDFFRVAGAAAVAGVGGALAASGEAAAQAHTLNDADILNFALNLEYLEAQFYSYAATGSGLSQSMLTGTGTQGRVIDDGAAKVNFSDPTVAAYAKEIAHDEIDHVNFLRKVLGNGAVAQPTIDVSTRPNGAFSAAAQAAGLVPAGQSFNPYASDDDFLLGAFIFEDVGVTAYHGAAPLIQNTTYLEAAAGILAVEAYHAGIIRTALFARGVETPSLVSSADAISDARDSLDGKSDDDKGLGTTTRSTLFPADANSIAFARTTGHVLNIVYLTSSSALGGGFFPNGVNGFIRRSAATTGAA